MTDKAQRFRVIVPTTAGLLDVERLIEEDIGASVICVGGTTRHNPATDKAYTDFVRQGTGVVQRLFGHGSYRLELSGEIDHGLSWQLPVLAAHALQVAGRLSEVGKPADTIVWATGQVGYDLKVGAVDHVSEKLAASLERLTAERAAGRHVIVVWPSANTGGIAPDLRRRLDSLSVEIIAADTIADLIDRLRPGAAAAKQASVSWPVYAGGAMAVLALLGLATWQLLPKTPRPDIEIELVKASYRVGEPFSFAVVARKDCPYLVFTVDANDVVNVKDPAQAPGFMGDATIKAGERREIPLPGGAGRAYVEPPTGQYLIGAVCDRSELSRLGLVAPPTRTKRNFKFKEEEPRPVVDRGALAKAAKAYEVRER